MQSQVWTKALAACADPPRANEYLEKLHSTSGATILKKATAEQARILIALLSGSQALSELLIAHPDWLPLVSSPQALQYPRQEQGLRRELGGLLRPPLEARDYAAAFARLRQFKQREMLRIAARDLARVGSGAEITREISNVADVCLDAVFQICRRQLTERVGEPYHQDAEGRWHPTPFCVLGLGKLGGQDLNYSSDIDVMFLYAEEGEVFKEKPRKGDEPGRRMPNHQFFKRLSEAIVAEIGRMTPEGTLFRIDLRLRPEGRTGPWARSLSSCENYYAQWGQTWERMMLIKARCVAGDAVLAAEFVEMIQPFRYPRSIGERILGEVAAMKQRIEKEVVRAGEIERNVKLGRGGIREIEFITQTLQLIHAGRLPFLQEAQTLPALERLVKYDLLPASTVEALTAAYAFLRDVEHRLQMENNLQTHTIPTERKARERLARLMGFPTLKEFEAARAQHTQRVREAFETLLKAETPEPASLLPRQFDGAEAEWKGILADHSFRDPEKCFGVLKNLAQGPGYVHVSQQTVDLALQLFARILALCPKKSGGRQPPSQPAPPAKARLGAKAASRIASREQQAPQQAAEESPLPLERGEGEPQPALGPTLSDPDRVLVRLASFVEAYGARGTLFETWVSNPSLFKLLVLLFDRSEFLAEVAIRTPDLLDELEMSGQLRRRKNAEEILRDLRHGHEDEDQRLWLRRYHQVELMRLGLRDILGLVDFEQNLVELSALADACLQYALEVALRKHKLKTPPFVIIGLGKLGGVELTYGSDLDVTFVADPKVKDVSKLLPLAIEVMELLSAPTESGRAFSIDARLRPDGEKGLLVNTLEAYEQYYRHRAQLWEIQALTRTRPIAGDLKLSERFQVLAAELTNFSLPPPNLAAYSADWKQQIAHMRERIEKERTPPGKNALAIKTGTGGLIDAEFIAQTLCLTHGWQEPNTLRALERARDAQALAKADADLLIENYRQLRRIEGILRRWSYEGEVLLPDDPAPMYRVAVRCGFRQAEEFLRAVESCRRAIRSVYARVMGEAQCVMRKT